MRCGKNNLNEECISALYTKDYTDKKEKGYGWGVLDRALDLEVLSSGFTTLTVTLRQVFSSFWALGS